MSDHIYVESRENSEGEEIRRIRCDHCESWASQLYGFALFREQHANCEMRAPWLDLYKILPDVDVDSNRYRTSEQDDVDPALQAAGYELLGGWKTGDGDSFGPLTRWRRVKKDDKEYRVIYG